MIVGINRAVKVTGKALTFVALVCASQAKASSFFGGYEFGEMALNDFRNFAGEIGMSLDNDRAVRLVYMNVALSERHLSSNEARAVDGHDVEGLWKGAEVFYDLPIQGNLSWGVSAGYYTNRFHHTSLDESVSKDSATVGAAISYSDDNLFGVDSLYWRFSVPVRFYLDPMERTTLGDTVVQGGSFDMNPWMFVGLRF